MAKITADNFITDDKTNEVYVSKLIDTESGGLDKQTRSVLKTCIEAHFPDLELLINTRDVWARDYMPIQLTQNLFLGYTYNPDYLVKKDPKYITNWQLHKVYTQKQEKLFDKRTVVPIPLILDGGNVVKAIWKGKPCMIMCNKVLTENNVTENEFRDWWDQWWNKNFDGTEMKLVLLPWEGEKDNPIGHADGMVRYIGNGHVLMTNYLDFDKKYEYYKKEEERFGYKLWKALSEAGFEVKKLEFWDKFDGNDIFKILFDESWCYINYLQVDNRILVPRLGYPELDEEARTQIENAFEKTGLKVDVKTIECNMTPIVKDMNDKMNSGGALNCLTWTIQTNK